MPEENGAQSVVLRDGGSEDSEVLAGMTWKQVGNLQLCHIVLLAVQEKHARKGLGRQLVMWLKHQMVLGQVVVLHCSMLT